MIDIRPKACYICDNPSCPWVVRDLMDEVDPPYVGEALLVERADLPEDDEKVTEHRKAHPQCTGRVHSAHSTDLRPPKKLPPSPLGDDDEFGGCFNGDM